jgi:MATE family multidrug resistance protein
MSEPTPTWSQRWRQSGGPAELLRLAWPLIVSNGFMTLQLTIDRIFLSRRSNADVAAAMPAVMVFWTVFALPQNTVSYVTTFIAQYIGADRPERVGAVLGQALWLSVIGGVVMMLLIPLAPLLMALGDHPQQLQALEITFLQCLAWAALPGLIVAAVSGFFAGKGETGSVMLINAVGLVVNAALDYALIFGNWGFPELGIAGAGWATVAGNVVSALLGLALLFRADNCTRFHLLAGWRYEAALMRRLLRFGLPNGLQWALDGLAFTMFVMLVGGLGTAEAAATTIAVTLNLLAFLPTMGMGQAVAVLVGQRLGEDRPDLAELTVWTGCRLGWLLMTAVALLYAFAPQVLLEPFRNQDPGQFEAVAATVPVLLRFVAVYCLFDSLNLIFAFALRGAGDTRFVTAASFGLAWPLMVLPTWAALTFGWGLYWAWTFATIFIIALAFVLAARFRAGRWKTIRVIEAAPAEEPLPDESLEPVGPSLECRPLTPTEDRPCPAPSDS